MSGHFYQVKPKKLKSSYRPENWVFAYYIEFPSQRDDGLWFHAYLFRDVYREIFGASLYLDENPKIGIRNWATKVIIDKTYRESYIIQDKEIIKLWKRH
jgi:hypothetical protein